MQAHIAPAAPPETPGPQTADQRGPACSASSSQNGPSGPIALEADAIITERLRRDPPILPDILTKRGRRDGVFTFLVGAGPGGLFPGGGERDPGQARRADEADAFRPRSWRSSAERNLTPLRAPPAARVRGPKSGTSVKLHSRASVGLVPVEQRPTASATHDLDPTPRRPGTASGAGGGGRADLKEELAAPRVACGSTRRRRRRWCADGRASYRQRRDPRRQVVGPPGSNPRQHFESAAPPLAEEPYLHIDGLTPPLDEALSRFSRARMAEPGAVVSRAPAAWSGVAPLAQRLQAAPRRGRGALRRPTPMNELRAKRREGPAPRKTPGSSGSSHLQKRRLCR